MINISSFKSIKENLEIEKRNLNLNETELSLSENEFLKDEIPLSEEQIEKNKIIDIEEKAESYNSKLMPFLNNNSVISIFYMVIRDEIVIILYEKSELSEFFSFNMNDIVNIYYEIDDEAKDSEIFKYKINLITHRSDNPLEIVYMKEQQAIELIKFITEECIKQKLKKRL
jgi:hypothetical protein